MPVTIPIPPYIYEVEGFDTVLENAHSNNDEVTVYTCPASTIAYWLDYFVAITNATVALRTARLFFYDDDDTELWRIDNLCNPQSIVNFNGQFQPPLKLTAGQYITYKTYNASVEAFVSIRVLEIGA